MHIEVYLYPCYALVLFTFPLIGGLDWWFGDVNGFLVLVEGKWKTSPQPPNRAPKHQTTREVEPGPIVLVAERFSPVFRGGFHLTPLKVKLSAGDLKAGPVFEDLQRVPGVLARHVARVLHAQSLARTFGPRLKRPIGVTARLLMLPACSWMFQTARPTYIFGTLNSELVSFSVGDVSRCDAGFLHLFRI